MEGAPYIPEQNHDDLERREKHIAQPERIGSLTFEANPEKDPDERQYGAREHLGKALISKEALSDTTEVSYEQDPALRHPQNNGAISRASGRIGSLLSSKSDMDLGGSAASSNASKPTSSSKSMKATKSLQSVADTAMYAVITGLLLLIILVIILKR